MTYLIFLLVMVSTMKLTSSLGQSAAWNVRGELLAQMDAESEGLVVLDTAGGRASVELLLI